VNLKLFLRLNLRRGSASRLHTWSIPWPDRLCWTSTRSLRWASRSGPTRRRWSSRSRICEKPVRRRRRRRSGWKALMAAS